MLRYSSGAHVGPVSLREKIKVVFEVDERGTGGVQQWKRPSSTYRFFSELYN